MDHFFYHFCFFPGAALEFVAATEITGAIISETQVEMLSVAGAVSALDFETLSIGFASALGIEVDVGMYLFAYDILLIIIL